MLTTRDAAEFAAALPATGRLMGLDHGTERIGVAVSDGMRMVSSPLEIISPARGQKALGRIKDIAGAQRLTGIVIGYPLNMDGSEGPRCQSVRAFARSLQQQIGLPILLWDERLSSSAIERAMLEADLSRQKRAGKLDAAAASFILQGVLDRLTK